MLKNVKNVVRGELKSVTHLKWILSAKIVIFVEHQVDVIIMGVFAKH